MLTFVVVFRAKQWLPYLLPPKEDEDMVLQESGVLSSDTLSSPQTSANLRQLLDETSDLIESPSFIRILTSLNNEGFAKLIEQKCANNLFNKQSQTEAAAMTNFSSAATIVPSSLSTTPKAKLATVLALITREAHNIGNGTNPPNEYLAAMEQGVQELEAFAAVIYSSNHHLGLMESEIASAKLPSETQTTYGSEFAPANIASTEQSIAARLENEEFASSNDQAFEKVWGKAVEHSASGDEA